MLEIKEKNKLIPYGSYVEWPKGAPGVKNVINIKTDINWVE